VLADAAAAVVADATDPAAIAITDAADAALARARAAGPGSHALTTTRPQRADGSADYGPATGLAEIRR
jgi:hypothetical protein